MKKIKLTQGQFALVDDADYIELSQYKWHVHKDLIGKLYARRTSIKKKGKHFEISMARQILGLEKGDPREADHVDHNTLDNRRDNLRVCTHQQNSSNRKVRSNTSSQYKGVCWHRLAKKWMVGIMVNGESKYLGLYESETEAALVYNKAAKKYHGVFACVNQV